MPTPYPAFSRIRLWREWSLPFTVARCNLLSQPVWPRGPVDRPAIDLDLDNKRKVALTLKKVVPALEKILSAPAGILFVLPVIFIGSALISISNEMHYDFAT